MKRRPSSPKTRRKSKPLPKVTLKLLLSTKSGKPLSFTGDPHVL